MVIKMLNSKMNKKQFSKSIEDSIKSSIVLEEFCHSLLSPVDQTVEEEIVDSPVDEFQEKVLEMVNEIGWEGVYNKLTVKSTVVTKEGSKMSKAVDIYQEMISQNGVRRIDIIKQFMSQLDMSKEGASTYFQNVKTKLNKS